MLDLVLGPAVRACLIAVAVGLTGVFAAPVQGASTYDDPVRTIASRGALRFGQASVKSTFAHGPFAGKSVGEVSKLLRAGKASADQLPVEFIVRNGERIALNNRSLLALRRAGLKPTKLINRTGVSRYEKLLDAHLRGASPSDVIRVRGGPPGTSLIE